MKIIDLEQKHVRTYFMCLEEWSDEMKEAGDLKESWYEKMKDKGLRVKLAEADDKSIVGMIQYMPAELGFVENGQGFYLIKCIWVHGYKEGVGNWQKKGVGSMLLQAAEDDCKQMGMQGILAWGIAVPVWMKASWYKKYGYKKIDKDGVTVLMMKSFSESVEKPTLIRMRKKPPTGNGVVEITIFQNGWCPAANIVVERTKRAAEAFEGLVHIKTYDMTDRRLLTEWGISQGVYIDGRPVQKGPPPSYDKIVRMIQKRVRKL